MHTHTDGQHFYIHVAGDLLPYTVWPASLHYSPWQSKLSENSDHPIEIPPSLLHFSLLPMALFSVKRISDLYVLIDHLSNVRQLVMYQ